jgi:hypothetical protein
MAECLQTYCMASRRLSELQKKSKEDLQEIRDAKKAANSLLLELQPEEEMVAKLPDVGCFSVRVKVLHTRPAQPLEILTKLEDFWSSGRAQEWKARVEENPELDPMTSFLDTFLNVVWPATQTKRSLEIRPVKENSSRVQDLPEAPAQNVPLLASIIEAKRLVAARMASVREDKKKLQEQCQEAEAKIIPDLAQLPEGYIRRVDMKDSAGDYESFYVRLKQPKAAPVRKVSSRALERALKGFLDEHSGVDSRQEILERMSSPAFGSSMCDQVVQTLVASLRRETKPRIALDRLREAKGQHPGS